MNVKDLKLGTIIEQNDSYAVVLGIANFPDYEQSFVAKDAYAYIPIVLYKLVSLTLPESMSHNENMLNAKKQFINNLLTVNMQGEIKSNLMYTAYLVQVTNFDMKPRTKEISEWLMKNKLLNQSALDGILDIEDRKKRLNKIITKRDNYYKSLWTKLSCYDNPVNKRLERNFEKLKFGEVYVSDGCFCICMDIQNNSFYCIDRNGNLKQNILFFVLTQKDILLYCSMQNPNLLYDTGANIMDYWWNKENYECITEYKEYKGR